ncbi:HDOD domain-containing protein [Vibrio mexicanus]|uniref:HDOD domain-containing protein n=1 Tax=Vibrio mexicanus TaxID=1004326 RepID=UPI000B0D1E73
MPVSKLFGRFPDFSYFLSVAYSPSFNFSKLNTLITLDTQLRANIVELANNPKFCSRLGKTARNVTDCKVAIGQVGLDNLRLLIPVLMAKALLKWDDKQTKTIAPKLWQHTILTANVTRLRLVESKVKEPDEGIAIGILRTLYQFGVVNHFSQLFEDALVEKMQQYRAEHRREEYYACAEVQPTFSVLPNVLVKLEHKLTEKLVEHIEWSGTNLHLKNALIEDIEKQPVLERTPHGVALAQARAYSIFDCLDRSNVFVEKHKPFWFAHVQMPPQDLERLKQLKPGKIGLQA